MKVYIVGWFAFDHGLGYVVGTDFRIYLNKKDAEKDKRDYEEIREKEVK